VLPFGASIFVPGKWLRGDFELWTALVAPVGAAVASVLAAFFVWEKLSSRYQSTGN
jgi:hypothetical protein